MTSALKNYLSNNKCHIEKEEFDKLICREVIENGCLMSCLTFFMNAEHLFQQKLSPNN